MGLSVDTASTFDWVIVEDRAKPVQRSLQFRFVSSRTLNAIRGHFQKAAEAQTTDHFIQETAAGIRLAIAGWTSLRNDHGELVDYDPARLDEVLTQGDFADVQRELLTQMTITEAEKKRSALLSLSITASSAGEEKMGDA